jgi:hypothetical protein
MKSERMLTARLRLWYIPTCRANRLIGGWGPVV